MGQTGAGKSTLIDYLANIELVVKGRDIDLKDLNNPDAMKIGLGGDSETRYPQCLDVNNFHCYDRPGFNETRGIDRHLVSAAFIKHVLTESKSIRFIFVSGLDEVVAGRGKLFKELMSVTQNLFPASNVEESSLFVITRTDFQTTDEFHKYLINKCAPNDKQSLMRWIQSNKFYQMHIPLNGMIQQDDRAVILNATQSLPTCVPGRVDINAIHPYEVQEELMTLFQSFMKEILFNDIVNTSNDSSFMDLERTIQTFSDELKFWNNLRLEMAELPIVQLLKDLSDSAYQKACDEFEREQFEYLREVIANLKMLKGNRILHLKAEIDMNLRTSLQSYIGEQKQRLLINENIADYSEERAESSLQQLEPMLVNLPQALQQGLDSAISGNQKLKAALEIPAEDCLLKKDIYQETLGIFNQTTRKDSINSLQKQVELFQDHLKSYLEALKSKRLKDLAIQAKERALAAEKQEQALRVKAERELAELEEEKRENDKKHQAELSRIKKERSQQQMTYYIDPQAFVRPSYPALSFGGMDQMAMQHFYPNLDLSNYSGRSSSSSSAASASSGRPRMYNYGAINSYRSSHSARDTASHFKCSTSTVYRAGKRK